VELANISVRDAQHTVESVVESLSDWPMLARNQEVSAAHIRTISKRLECARSENASLLSL
jgi:hypothetical protein